MALRAATPLSFPAAWVEESVGEQGRVGTAERVAEQQFAEAFRDGLGSVPLRKRVGRLPSVIGSVAEAVASRLLVARGFSVFADISVVGVRGVDLLLLSPSDDVLALEVKGTLRPGSLPRFGRSRLRQMSAEWLDHSSNPAMIEWGLDSLDVFTGVIAVDLRASSARVIVSGDHDLFVPVVSEEQLLRPFVALVRPSARAHLC